MDDMHEATFVWPEVDAQDVIVTGSFDQWSSSMHLTKTPRGFEGKVKLPWGGRTQYKFVVDGYWRTAQSQPEEPDGSGNVNNVYECPSKPVPAVAESLADLPLVFPKGVDSTSFQTHGTVVAPVVEDEQEMASDRTLDQVRASPTPANVETTQTVSGSEEAAVDPIVQTTRETVVEQTPEPVKEPVNDTSEAMRTSTSDPPKQDQIPIATSAPKQDVSGVTIQPESDLSELESKETVPADVETAPTAATSESPVPVASVTAATTEKTVPRADYPPTNTSIVSPEAAGVDSLPSSNDTAKVTTPTASLPPEPADGTLPVAEPETPNHDPATFDTSGITAPDARPDAPPMTEIAQSESQPVDQPTTSTVDAKDVEGTAVTGTTAPIDHLPGVDEPSVAPQVPPIQTDARPTETPAASTVAAVEPAETAPSPTAADKSPNDLSPTPTGSSIPIKSFETSESTKPQAFPVSDTKTTASTASSPAELSKFGSTRKKRLSLFGKVKSLFHSDKEEKKDQK